MSIASAWACEPGVDLAKIGPALVLPDSSVRYSYNLTIEYSTADWPNRLDHYLNFGSSRIFWEELLASMIVLIVATFMFCGVISSALHKDNEVLGFLRAKYRQSRFNTARSRFLATGPGYAHVEQ
jgi:hypothetical protein